MIARVSRSNWTTCLFVQLNLCFLLFTSNPNSRSGQQGNKQGKPKVSGVYNSNLCRQGWRARAVLSQAQYQAASGLLWPGPGPTKGHLYGISDILTQSNKDKRNQKQVRNILTQFAAFSSTHTIILYNSLHLHT